MPVSVREILVIMSRKDDDVSTNITETPSRKKKRSGNEEDGTGNNTISTYTESVQQRSPASNTRSGGKRKCPPLNDTTIPSDSDSDDDNEEINKIKEAALLSRNNPTDGDKASAEVLQLNSYERSFYELVSRQGPRRSSAIWKYNYFKEVHINRRGKRILTTERKFPNFQLGFYIEYI